MGKWDYRVLPGLEAHQEGILDELGQAGWELVGFDAGGSAFFKRPIAEEKANPVSKLRGRSK